MLHCVTTLELHGPRSPLAVHMRGPAEGPVVLMAHSILSSSRMWEAQAHLLADEGMRVVCMDTRGHGLSKPAAPPYDMDELVADTVAVMDALRIRRAHYVGLSLGGMSGFGLGIAHGERLLSLLLCDARADAPPEVASPWDARIEAARAGGCGALAAATVERWFGRDFLDANPQTAEAMREMIAGTSVDGFEGCARAIQGLDYIDDVSRIRVPTTLLVGANDGALPEAMRQLRERIPDSRLELVAGAGHLPNIEQPERFEAALLGHFARVAGRV